MIFQQFMKIKKVDIGKMEREKICAELFFILEQLPYNYSKLIPSNIIDKLKTEMSVEWYSKFDKDKVFYKQNIKRETILMLSFLYYEYLCNNDLKQE